MAVLESLAKQAQDDWAAGMFHSAAPHLIPSNGAYSITNMLLDDDGSLYKRGGSQYLTTAAFGASLRFIWDGNLKPGGRTVIASPSAFGVLPADDTVPISLGGAGLTNPRRAVEIEGVLAIGGGTLYGGSRKTADYSTGTMAVTNGSTTVTGAGTAWLANLDAGMFLRRGTERYYHVASVDSDTQLTLSEAYTGTTGSGLAYAATRLGSVPRISDCYAVAGGRLLSCEGNRVYLSNYGNPFIFGADDYHEFPEGATVIGAQGLRDTAFIFTTVGVFGISNIELELVDDLGNAQQRVTHLNRELVLWGHEGISAWAGALIVPAIDGCYLFDGQGAPQRISGSISERWWTYVALGYKPGVAAVHLNHYFLPVLDVANNVVDMLVCRLDRPVASRMGTIFPWVHLDGTGIKAAALAVRIAAGTRQPLLLGASRTSAARVLKFRVFDHEDYAGRKADPDGSAPVVEITLRDVQTGQMVENWVRRVRIRYELEDAASDNPVIQGAWADGARRLATTDWGLFDWGQADWGSAEGAEFVALTGDAPEEPFGVDPHEWEVNDMARYFRLRLRQDDPAKKFVLRSVEYFVRPSTRT